MFCTIKDTVERIGQLKLTIVVRAKISYKFYIFISWKFLWVQAASEKVAIKL